MNPDDERHGTRAGYLAHRLTGNTVCDLCAAANRRYERLRSYDAELGRARVLPNKGTQRRIRALVALGWSYLDLGGQLGVSQQSVWQIANRRGTVRATTAQRIAALYDQLSMTPAPPGKSASYSRTVARKHGWLPPLAWDDIDTDPEPPAADPDNSVDHVVVMRLLEGRNIPSSRAEREEAIRRWVADGGTKTEFCNLHGWAPQRYGALRLVEEAS